MMKKYISLILFFCSIYSISFNAQSNSFNNVADRLSNFDLAFSAIQVIDFNSNSDYHFFNPFAFNPAMAGIEDKQQLTFDWNRKINHTASLSYEQPIVNINSSIGIQYEYSQQEYGKIHRYGLAYNYGFRWKENTQLRLGIQFSQINIKTNDYSFLPLEGGEWHSFPSIDFGLAFQFKQLRLGASVQNLVSNKFAQFNEFTETYITQTNTQRTLNLSAANTFKLNKKLDWSVAFLLRFDKYEAFNDNIYYYYYPYQYGIGRGNSKQQHDFSSYLFFQKRYMIGATYRTQFDPVWIGFVGVKLKEKVNLKFSLHLEKEEYESRFWEGLVQYEF